MRVALLASVWLLVSCDMQPGTDAGTDAPVLADTPAADVPPDAPIPASPQCQPCRRDADCGEGAFCTVFDDATWACVTACASDIDCEGTSVPSTCGEEAPGLPLGCRPSAGSCVVSAPGSACTGTCSGTYDVCAEPEAGLGSYCTSYCDTDADCPMGFRRCAGTAAGRVCVRDPLAPPERCTTLSPAVAVCGAARSCGAGNVCVGPGAGRCLPVAGPSGCGAGSAPAMAGADRVCVPNAAIPTDGLPLDAMLPDCACMAEDGGLFDEAAALAGRDRCELMFPHALLDLFPTELSHDTLRLSFTDPVHSDWLAPPRFARAIGAGLDGATPDAMLALLSALGDAPFETSAPTEGDAAASLATLIETAGGTANRAVIDAALAPVTGERNAALGELFGAVEAALRAREAAIATYDPAERAQLFAGPSALYLPGIAAPDTSRFMVGAMRGDVDVAGMARAAAAVLSAIARVRTALVGAGPMPTALSIATPAGTVVIGGASVDRYEAASYLLVLELGGDDVYRAPIGATASPTNGVSVLLDLDGVDDYGYAEVPVAADVGPAGHTRLASDGAGRAAPAGGYGPYTLSGISRQGAGRLGIGIAFDGGPQGDRYQSLRMSQGYGALGVGVLVDAGGDDEYDGEAGVQGAAVAGVGLLLDLDGVDAYRTYHASQGFAYVRGVGALVDVVGNDTYFANPGDVLYFSPQSPGVSNGSFCQGVGFGRRDDARGNYMSGGLGILRDRAGDDRYTCGIFGQATGYWYGTGLLLEGAGSDHYDGEWYVQAGNAHFAIAVLLDAGGDDIHNETAVRRNAAVAGGHDYSSAWFVDVSGDDRHRGPGLSFGTGHAGGFGAFVDLGGSDSYDATGDLSFGNASIETPGDPARRMSGTVGIFVDREGIDTYTRPTIGPVTNDATWTQSARTGESENGAGIDRATGSVGAGLE